MKFLPNFIYESLPYLYVAIGIFSMARIPGKLGGASGLLLLCLGLLVFHMRRSYRAQLRERARIFLQ